MIRAFQYGGGGGIRTHERFNPLPVFKTGAFNHSATPPVESYALYRVENKMQTLFIIWLKIQHFESLTHKSLINYRDAKRVGTAFYIVKGSAGNDDSIAGFDRVMRF